MLALLNTHKIDNKKLISWILNILSSCSRIIWPLKMIYQLSFYYGRKL